jgi:hypothetical protein
MNGSYNYLVHIIGFGLLSLTFVGGFLLDRKFRKEKDWQLKLYVLGIARPLGIATPIVAAILLITGIGNIHNRLMGTEVTWLDEGWLVAKIIFFAVMVLNGLIFGPSLSRKRARVVKGIVDGSGAADAEQKIVALNRQITMFYLVQAILLIAILYLSTFGPGKHPGSI